MKLFFISFFCFILTVAASEETYLEYRIGGSLGARAESLEKFELDFDQHFIWFSNETGGLDEPGCMTDIAEFSGKLTQNETDLLIKKAHEAALAVPASVSDGIPVKGITKRLKLIVGDNSFSANLSGQDELPKAWEEMDVMIRQLTQKLAPKKMMSMSARLLNTKHLQVRYQYWGKKPFVLIIPNDPALAFKLQGYRLEYVQRPAMELQQMGPTRKSIDLTFKLFPIAEEIEISKLYYANKQAMHHANMAFMKGHLRPDSINICSVVKKR